jgi:hypothetical protein
MISGTVKFGLKVEIYAAVESLQGWGSATALASPVNVCIIQVGVGFIGDSKTSLYVEFGMFKHVTLDGGHFR